MGGLDIKDFQAYDHLTRDFDTSADELDGFFAVVGERYDTESIEKAIDLGGFSLPAADVQFEVV